MEHYLHLQTGTACWMHWTCYDKNFLITIDISGAVKYLPKIPRIRAFCNISLQRNVCLTKRCHRTSMMASKGTSWITQSKHLLQATMVYISLLISILNVPLKTPNELFCLYSGDKLSYCLTNRSVRRKCLYSWAKLIFLQSTALAINSVYHKFLQFCLFWFHTS